MVSCVTVHNEFNLLYSQNKWVNSYDVLYHNRFINKRVNSYNVLYHNRFVNKRVNSYDVLYHNRFPMQCCVLWQFSIRIQISYLTCFSIQVRTNSQNCNLNTPQDITSTHILVFPTSATAQVTIELFCCFRWKIF